MIEIRRDGSFEAFAALTRRRELSPLSLSLHLAPSRSYEPRTKLLASERGTWAQRAGTDLPILLENGEPITYNRFLFNLHLDTATLYFGGPLTVNTFCSSQGWVNPRFV